MPVRRSDVPGGDALTLAVVPARGGSRGIPRKNLAALGGRPLIAWSIDAALGARRIARVVVSSDDPDILAVGASYGADPVVRPAALATDRARSEEAVRHALETVGSGWDIVCLLQPTSPLRTGDDVDAALALLGERGDADAVISVYEPVHSPFKAFQADERGHLVGVVDDDAPFRPRQELPRTYFPNGAIYAVRVPAFLETGSLLGRGAVPYVMPRERSLDIDDGHDLRRAEAALRALPVPPRRLAG